MKLGKALYFGDLVLAAVALAGRSYQAMGLWLLALLAGLVAWSLVEYVVHRWIYHRVPPFERFHDAHHADPKELIGAPSFLMVGAIFAIFFAPLLALGLLTASGVTSGALIGYIGYMLVHHGSHHWVVKPGSWLYQARLRHMVHHYQDTPGNYGIITSFWDHVFSTYVRRRSILRV
jgi:sterol desaturase/sphingolipid hydroxylase (fatty acid hydroxylase superfamily)